MALVLINQFQFHMTTRTILHFELVTDKNEAKKVLVEQDISVNEGVGDICI
jgi:hypothetical protein